METVHRDDHPGTSACDQRCAALQGYEHVQFHLDQAQRHARRAMIAASLSVAFAIVSLVFALLAELFGGAS